MQQEDVPAGDTTVTLTYPIVLDLQNGTELQSTDVDSCWFAVRENATGDGKNGYSWSYIHTSRASGPVSHAKPHLNFAQELAVLATSRSQTHKFHLCSHLAFVNSRPSD